MAKERNAFKAGLFIVVSIALTIAVIVAIRGIGTLLEPDQVRTVTFTLADDIGGLRVGDDVRVGGLKVGIVRSLKIDTEARPPRIIATFNMPKRLPLRNRGPGSPPPIRSRSPLAAVMAVAVTWFRSPPRRTRPTRRPPTAPCKANILPCWGRARR